MNLLVWPLVNRNHVAQGARAGRSCERNWIALVERILPETSFVLPSVVCVFKCAVWFPYEEMTIM